jgi:predicted negative regulator of RcsB-dependent stress response
MAVYDLEEQEQIDELKTWWKQYGNLVTNGLLVVAVSLAAWQGWNVWQRNQAADASHLYAAVERSSSENDAKKARDATGELIEKFSRTNYAPMAAMLSARTHFQSADTKTAKTQMTWALEHAADSTLRDLARLRLASVLLDEKSNEEARKLLETEPSSSAFLPRHHELKGDVFWALGKADEARMAYQTALTKFDELQKAAASSQQSTSYRDLLVTKMESIQAATGGK